MKYIITLITIMAATLSMRADTERLTESPADSTLIAPIQGNFSKFEYKGYRMLIPSPAETRATEQEAVIKTADGTLGMSLKIESDKGASADAAIQMCRRMAGELLVKGAAVAHLSIHGLRGARLTGTAEGVPVTVLILAAKGEYL